MRFGSSCKLPCAIQDWRNGCAASSNQRHEGIDHVLLQVSALSIPDLVKPARLVSPETVKRSLRNVRSTWQKHSGAVQPTFAQSGKGVVSFSERKSFDFCLDRDVQRQVQERFRVKPG